MRKIFIVRHANTKYNTEKRWQGRIDLDLDEMGKWMAKRVALRLSYENVDVIYSSPLKRARQTAEEIAKVHGLDVVIDDRLIEGELSLWEGMKADDVKVKFKKEYEEWAKNPRANIPGVENVESVYRRAVDFLESLDLERYNGIVVVTHAIVIRAIVCYVMKMPLESFREFLIGNASITTLVVHDNNWWRILNLNERGFLIGD